MAAQLVAEAMPLERITPRLRFDSVAMLNGFLTVITIGLRNTEKTGRLPLGRGGGC